MESELQERFDVSQESKSIIRTAQRIQHTAEQLQRWAKNLKNQESAVKHKKLNAERIIHRRLEAVRQKERQVQKALEYFRMCTESVDLGKHNDIETEETAKYLGGITGTVKNNSKAAKKAKGSPMKILMTPRRPYTRRSWFGSFLSWRTTTSPSFVKETEIPKQVQKQKEIEVTSPLRPKNKRKQRGEDQLLPLLLDKDNTSKEPAVNTEGSKKPRKLTKEAHLNKENAQSKATSSAIVVESDNSS